MSPAKLQSDLGPVWMSPEWQVSQAVSRWVKFCPEHQDKKFLCYNLPTVSRLQDGPQCGLVALAMAGSDTRLELVVREALDRGYTKQGEMFSVVMVVCFLLSFQGQCSGEHGRAGEGGAG